MISRRFLLQSAAAVAAYSGQGFRPAHAENAPGVTDTEIKIGQTMPYSGPVSAFGIIGRTEPAYFKMINEQGGVNGRKLNLISVDDAYSPPKTVEQTRRVVEQEQVAFIFGTVGTAPNTAISTYLNENKIPQLFIASGVSKFTDPQRLPWTITFDPNRRSEGRLLAKHIAKTRPDAKIGILYQNDDLGRDYLAGVRDGLGADHATMLAKAASYEVSDPTVDSQIITLQGAGVDSLIIAATPKAAAQAIRKVYDLGWAPERYLATIAQSIATVLKPAGIEKSMGVITNLWSKDPTDPRWKDDPGCKEWAAFDLLGLQPIERDVLKLEMRRHQPSDRGDRCEVGFVSQNDEVSEFAEQSLDGRIGRHHQDRTLAQADAWQGHDTDEPAGGGHEGAKLIDRRAGEEADDGLLGAKRQPDQPGHMLGAHREENDIAFGDHGFIAVFADHPLVSRRKRTGAGLGPGGQVDLVVRISLAAARNPCTTASVIAPVPINPKLAIG